MAVKGLVAAIVQFLTQQLEDGDITADSRESLEVAIQCLESAYNVQASDTPTNFKLYDVYKMMMEFGKPDLGPEATPEAKAEAEKLKNEGNALMKADKYYEAIANYSKAMQLDGRNAVYYCNRAAAYSKIGNHQQAIIDCNTALSIDPSYSKAYGRLGLAYSSLERHKEAKESYKKALEMEPDNESYQNNLQVAEQKLAQQGVSNMGLGGTAAGAGAGGIDLSAFLRNPALMTVARQMMSDPVMQSMMNNLITGNEQAGRMEVLLEAGHQLAQQVQNANPELVDYLRRQMGANGNDVDPPKSNDVKKND